MYSPPPFSLSYLHCIVVVRWAYFFHIFFLLSGVGITGQSHGLELFFFFLLFTFFLRHAILFFSISINIPGELHTWFALIRIFGRGKENVFPLLHLF